MFAALAQCYFTIFDVFYVSQLTSDLLNIGVRSQFFYVLSEDIDKKIRWKINDI